jgi:hypothetical protein
MKAYKILGFCAAMLAALTSCEHKELCYNHPHNGRVNVVFDWRNAPDANPESMALYLYPKDGGSVQRYDFTDLRGGQIEVLAGEYVAICVNSDTHYTLINQPSSTYTSAADLVKYVEIATETSTRTSRLKSISDRLAKVAPRADGTEDERVVYAPENIWTAYEPNVVVLNVADAGEQTITLYPAQAHRKYTVNLYNINNCENVTEMSATLSSMAGGVYAAMRTPTEEAVTIPFAVTVDRATSSATSTFNTFGHCPEGYNHTHTVVIYAVMSDGANYYGTVDVTDQVHNAPDPYNVVISIDNVSLPNPVIAGSETVTVEEWENFVINLMF